MVVELGIKISVYKVMNFINNNDAVVKTGDQCRFQTTIIITNKSVVLLEVGDVLAAHETVFVVEVASQVSGR